MRIRNLGGLFLCIVLGGCSWTERSNAGQTLQGVTQRQALIAAHRVLSDRSYEVADFDLEAGVLSTGWRDRAQRSNKVIVTVRQPTDAGSTESAAVALEIEAVARDRAVKGWTAGYPRPAEAAWLLRRIARAASEVALLNEVRAAATPAAPPPAPPVPPSPSPPSPPLRSCTASRECPPGQHCGAGHCVWECATDDECEGDASCDRRGRCVAPPPPAPPAPAAAEEE